MKATGKYPLRRGPEETARLQVQAAALEPGADILFARIGVRPGWRCLDLGCGVGGVTNLLSRRVGPTGRVVGLDQDAGMLATAREWAQANGLSNVEFVEGDAYRTGLPPESFDLVHVRFLFTTVGHDAGLLSKMLALTRPAGVVAVQETDLVTANCYPAHPAWDQLKNAIIAAFQRTGGATFAGRRMFGMLRRAGLEEVRFRPFVMGFTSDDPMAESMPSVAASLREAILESGLMSEIQLDEAIAACKRHLADPDTISTSYLMFQVWGRKPRQVKVR